MYLSSSVFSILTQRASDWVRVCFLSSYDEESIASKSFVHDIFYGRTRNIFVRFNLPKDMGEIAAHRSTSDPSELAGHGVSVMGRMRRRWFY